MAEQKSRELAVVRGSSFAVPQLIRGAGRKAGARFLEFFAANIRNRNTREAYYRALTDFFAWCDDHGFALIDIEPIVVAACRANQPAPWLVFLCLDSGGICLVVLHETTTFHELKPSSTALYRARYYLICSVDTFCR
jgi:hypothetical protein